VDVLQNVIIQFMSFENPQLGVEELPAYQQSDYQPLEPAYKKVIHRVSSFIVLGLLAVPISIYLWGGIEDQKWIFWVMLGLWFLISVIIMGIIGPAFRQKGYAVRERDISYKTGLINRVTTTIPFNRVQHCDIKQGLISRYFGLSKLNVYTAGGAKRDLSLPGLTENKAKKMMDYVLQKTLAFDEEE